MSIQPLSTPTFKKNIEDFESIENNLMLKWSYALKMKSEIPTMPDSTPIFEKLYSETVSFDKLGKNLLRMRKPQLRSHQKFDAFFMCS